MAPAAEGFSFLGSGCDRQKALDAGCNDYLAKPIAGDVLKKKLRHFLRC